MFIETLSVKNFKSIEDLSIDFKNLNGLYEISGPVGSGKTAIGEALLFALFGTVKDKTNEDLLQWGQKKAQIYLELTSKGHKVAIERELTKSGSKCEVAIDGKPLMLSNKRDTQKYLENEIYDVSRMTLELLCIISFNGFKSLSNLNASDTKKFLDQTFGLDTITTWATKAFDEKKESIKNKQDIEVQIRIAEENINLLKDQVIVDEVGLNKRLSVLKESLSEYKNNKNEIMEKRDLDLQQINSSLTELNKNLSVIVEKGKQNKRHIDFIEQGVCPTCGAPIDQSKLPEYQTERQELADKYKSISSKMKKIEHQKNQVRLNYSDPLERAQEQIDKVVSEISRINTELSHAKKVDGDLDLIENDKRRAETQLVGAEKESQDWTELYSYLQNEARQVVLNTKIPYINQNANRFLTKLGQSYQVKISPAFKVEISNTILKKDFSVSCLSAGQTKMLDMVLILAVLETLLSKVNFNICFCDELFSNMDADLRDQMCGLLKSTLREGQSIFVICHAPLNKDLMDGTITAQLKNLKSVDQMTF